MELSRWHEGITPDVTILCTPRKRQDHLPASQLGARNTKIAANGRRTEMGYSNERIIERLQLSGTSRDLTRRLTLIDKEIDQILRSGGTSREAREPQQRFNDLLPLP